MKTKVVIGLVILLLVAGGTYVVTQQQNVDENQELKRTTQSVPKKKVDTASSKTKGDTTFDDIDRSLTIPDGVEEILWIGKHIKNETQSYKFIDDGGKGTELISKYGNNVTIHCLSECEGSSCDRMGGCDRDHDILGNPGCSALVCEGIDCNGYCKMVKSSSKGLTKVEVEDCIDEILEPGLNNYQ